eukprot:1390543-Rhodomonas_salina.2
MDQPSTRDGEGGVPALTILDIRRPQLGELGCRSGVQSCTKFIKVKSPHDGIPWFPLLLVLALGVAACSDAPYHSNGVLAFVLPYRDPRLE